MKKLWLTYAWKDNEDKDIDFIIQEINSLKSIDIRFDRKNLIPGQRLWTQIGGIISDPNECDAWGIILTSSSIRSQPCVEELSYALDRALSIKKEQFPLFALLHKVTPSEMPPSLKIRLCIPLENNDWKKQVEAAVYCRTPGFDPKGLDEWIFKEHRISEGTYCLEIRPRFDRISPFAVVVDYAEKQCGNVIKCMVGPSNIIPTSMGAFGWVDSEETLTDGTKVWLWQANNEASSTNSYYLFYNKQPKRIWFGRPKNLVIKFSPF